MSPVTAASCSRRPLALLFAFLIGGCVAPPPAAKPEAVASQPAAHATTAAPASTAATATPAADASPLHGRLEQAGGMRILRVWGTPAERGFAHGKLLGDEIASVLRSEFEHRFARHPERLDLVRSSLARLIEFPADVQREIEALWRGIEASGADRDLPELGRPFDLQDLMVANALDVFGLMGCSGFTVWGDQVEGGGVLSGRNFDWPFTGPHLIEHVLLLVEHAADGSVVASVTWPGYVATVTGVNRDGVAAFLHVGTGDVTFTPEPESWPTAVAARQILQQVHGSSAAEFDRCRELLEYTSPPAGYITRVVLPRVPADGVPVGVFETDRNKVVAAPVRDPMVTTNHFVGRSDGRAKSKDSSDRERSLAKGLQQCLTEGDRAVSPAESWQLLAGVDRGGRNAFGTLHALVFRAEPWFFELRVAELRDGVLVPATRSSRRHVLSRDQLFARVPDQPRR